MLTIKGVHFVACWHVPTPISLSLTHTLSLSPTPHPFPPLALPSSPVPHSPPPPCIHNGAMDRFRGRYKGVCKNCTPHATAWSDIWGRSAACSLGELATASPGQLLYAGWQLVAKASHIVRGIDLACDALQTGNELRWALLPRPCRKRATQQHSDPSHRCLVQHQVRQLARLHRSNAACCSLRNKNNFVCADLFTPRLPTENRSPSTNNLRRHRKLRRARLEIAWDIGKTKTSA